MSFPRMASVVVVVLVSSSCGIKPLPPAPDDSAALVISREQIEKTGARTMWDALARTVRYTRFQESGLGTPERVRRRGSSSIILSDDMPIFIDEVRVLDVQVLASLSARDIESIRVLNGVHATTYYGTNAGDGVILIRTLEAERRPGS